MYDTAASLDAQLKAFDDIKRVVLQGYKEIREAKATSQQQIEMAVADQLGDFTPSLNFHGSFTKAIFCRGSSSKGGNQVAYQSGTSI